MPNSRKLKLSSRSFDSSEVVEYIYFVGSLSKDCPSRYLEEGVKRDERE